MKFHDWCIYFAIVLYVILSYPVNLHMMRTSKCYYRPAKNCIQEVELKCRVVEFALSPIFVPVCALTDMFYPSVRSAFECNVSHIEDVMSWRKATWKKGEQRITGEWKYVWEKDAYLIRLDDPDPITEQVRTFQIHGEHPQWGNWKLEK